MASDSSSDHHESIADLELDESEQLLALAIQESASKRRRKHKDVKFFKRFRDTRLGDSWYVGRDRWDAIVFIPKEDCWVFGIGIFEMYPNGHNFTMGYVYHIEDKNGNLIESSQIHEEPIEESADPQTHIIKHELHAFKEMKGLFIEQGQRFHFCMHILNAQRCYYSETGEGYRTQIVDNQDYMDMFEIRDSSHSNNSTKTNRGIIPGILFSV